MKLTTETIRFPEDIPYSLKESKEGFVKLLLLYAAMKRFEEGKVSLGKAASLAGFGAFAASEKTFRLKRQKRTDRDPS